VKVKPVIDALRARSVDVAFVHTEQHYDPPMNDVFLAELGLPEPDRRLGIGSGTHAEQTARVMLAFERVMAELAPDVVVVVGDVNSTMACALVAAKGAPRLSHVEAGLRSRDRSMPEEVNRMVTDLLSDDLFAPSPDAVNNLLAEGHSAERIHFVGNVMVDTLMLNLERARARPILSRLGVDAGAYGVLTLHRPINVDDSSMLQGLLVALGEVAAECPLVYPVHPRGHAVLDALEVPPGILIIDPLGYLDFVALEADARLVFTDSGGVQEETTVLGVPCLTLRDTTERPVTVTEGTNRVIGTDPERVVREARHLLVHRRGVDEPDNGGTRPALWDGKAAERIADVLVGSRRGCGHQAPLDGA
jgi:UDP-N-acetylglucosamine 2-epimerase (non-hydrolysing)